MVDDLAAPVPIAGADRALCDPPLRV